jgi:hypothetical protein
MYAESFRGENEGRLLRALQEGSASYFWVEHGKDILEVFKVEEGGYWCRFKGSGELLDAIGSHDRGLAHTFDGGGEPFLIRRACALPDALAFRVLCTFLREGTRSDEVHWGAGLVRDSFGLLWRDPESYEEDEAVDMLEEETDGFTLTLESPLEDRHAASAVWDTIARISVLHEEGLPFLARHPAAELRELELCEGLPLDLLQEVLDKQPTLETLTLQASDAVGLRSLRAPKLRELIVELDTLDDDESAELVRRLRRRTRSWKLAPDARLILPDEEPVDDENE